MNLHEIYKAPKEDENLKQGLYLVMDNEGKVIVRGTYKDGRKTGIWMYHDQLGNLTQRYDFTNSQLLYTNLDSGSFVTTQYDADSVYDTKEITPPLKIGGSTYALLLVYNSNLLPFEFIKKREDIRLKYIFDITADGKLESLIAEYATKSSKGTRKIPFRNLSTDILEFIPAKAKGIPIKSKIIISTTITVNELKIPGTNNVVTY